MTRFFTILFTISPCAFVFAQKSVSFQVLDANDSTYIPFATVYFPSLNTGYSANDQGYFSMNTKTLHASDSVLVSSLGYIDRTVTVDFLEQHVITLEANPKVLDEVIVRAKREEISDMIKDTDRFLKAHLGKEPYFLYAFYKEELIQNDHFVGYTEAYGVLHVSGYQPSYNRKNRLFSYDLAQWKNIRRSEYPLLYTCDSSRTIAIDKLLEAKSEYLFNGVLNKNPEDYEFTVDSAFSDNNSEILVVKFFSKENKYEGELWINEGTRELISLKIHDPEISIQLNETCADLSYGDFEISFVMLDGEYFVNYVSLTTYDKGKDLTENLIIRGGEFKKNDVSKLNYDQRVVLYNEMLNPVVMYDEGFWMDNALEVSGDLATDLETEISLSEQFFQMNGKRIIPLPDDFPSYDELYKNRDMFRLFMLNSDF